jgi:hypothetical protein
MKPFLAIFLTLSVLCFGCGGSTSSEDPTGIGGEAGSDAAGGAVDHGGASGNSGGGGAGGAGGGGASGGAGSGGGGAAGAAASDGTATRVACTNKLGNGLSATFGRLDGRLISLVPSGKKGCNGDSGHLHLQVSANGGVYDIAISLVSDKTTGSPEVSLLERDAPLIDGPWQEGWHTSGVSLDYAKTLGVHSTDFTPTAQATLEAKLLASLQGVNHVTVFATGYDQTGAHLVHRNSGGHDGALVIHPTTGAPHYFLFHFATQAF